MHKYLKRHFFYLFAIWLLAVAPFNSAIADLRPAVLLDWKIQDADLYEIVIKDQTNKVITKQILKNPPYNFIIPKLGKYFWKVRYKSGSNWSNFSEYAVVDAEDEISLLSKPLMLFPKDESKILLNRKDPRTVTFVWKETENNKNKYFLEMAPSKTGKPIVLPVKGGTATLKIPKKWVQVWWRVYAKSPYGNSSTSKDMYNVTLTYPKIQKPLKAAKLEEVKFNNRWVFNSFLGYSSSNYTLGSVDPAYSTINQEHKISGPYIHLNGELWPGFLKHKDGISATLKRYMLSSDEVKLNQTELGLEYGRIIFDTKASEHRLYVGGQYITSEINLFSINYSIIFGSVRYGYRMIHHENYFTEFSAQMLQSPNFTPSLRARPSFNYKVSSNFWVSAFAEYERHNYKIQPSNYPILVNFKFTNLVYGLGLKWEH